MKHNGTFVLVSQITIVNLTFILQMHSPSCSPQSRQRMHTHQNWLHYITHVALTQSHPRLTNGVPWHISYAFGLLLWDSMAWLSCMVTTIFIRIEYFSLTPLQRARHHHHWGWRQTMWKHRARRGVRSQLLHDRCRILDICPSCPRAQIYPRYYGHREQRVQAAWLLLC